MNRDRRRAAWLGILLILGIVFGILNTVPALEKPGYLGILAGLRTKVLIAVFFQAAMAVVYVCIAALTYPLIREYSQDLAVGYLGFRIIGSAFLFVGICSLLILLRISQGFAFAREPEAAYFIRTGELVRQCRDLLNHVGMILPWATGGSILYFSAFKTRLIPTWLAMWGMGSTALTIIATLLLMLDFLKMFTPAYFAMNMPAAVFELVLAGYLIARGFGARYAITQGLSGGAD